ncbi:MAG: deoxyribonuclease IV [Anaerolineae bacterium]
MPAAHGLNTKEQVRLGAHMSIAGGVDRAFDRALEVGCQTMQIFTKSSNQWRARPLGEREVERFLRLKEESGVWPVVAHDSYLINLASPDPELWRKSVEALATELERCATLGLRHLIIHPGAHMGAGEEAGLQHIAAALNEALERTSEQPVEVVLEITAGQGTGLGHRLEHLAYLMEQSVDERRLGVCFDTCHALAAGYDIRTREGYEAAFRAFDRVLGLERLRAFHLNDSKRGAGSRVDRHEHIGKGVLGLEPFRMLLNDARFRHLPMILETPKGPDMREDLENLATLRSLVYTDSP